jgi:hypothetical protein
MSLYDQLNMEMNHLTNDNIIKNNELKNLYKIPPKEEGQDEIHFDYITPNYIHQADTLILPNDQGFDKLLVVADQGSRLFDAEPLKDSSSETAFTALKTIYARNIIKKPKFIMCDLGTEFKLNFITGCNAIGIKVINGEVGRSRQLGIVERKNKIIGSLIHKFITETQISTKQSSSAWLHLIKPIVAITNKKTNSNMEKHPPKTNFPLDDNNMFPVSNNPLQLLKEGQEVRVQLDKPKDSEGNKLYGGFRSSDIRYDPTIRTIEGVYLAPSQPVMYYLDGGKKVMYTRQQLQKVTKYELRIPDKEVEEPIEQRFKVKKLLEREKRGRLFYFKVKWDVPRNTPDSTTWEKRNELMKDIPQMVKNFEAKL